MMQVRNEKMAQRDPSFADFRSLPCAIVNLMTISVDAWRPHESFRTRFWLFNPMTWMSSWNPSWLTHLLLRLADDSILTTPLRRVIISNDDVCFRCLSSYASTCYCSNCGAPHERRTTATAAATTICFFICGQDLWLLLRKKSAWSWWWWSQIHIRSAVLWRVYEAASWRLLNELWWCWWKEKTKSGKMALGARFWIRKCTWCADMCPLACSFFHFGAMVFDYRRNLEALWFRGAWQGSGSSYTAYFCGGGVYKWYIYINVKQRLVMHLFVVVIILLQVPWS